MAVPMSAIYDYEKRWFLAESVMAGLEGAVGGSKVNPNCLLPAWSYPCVSWPIPRRQSCSASKLVCESKCLEAAERPLVVGLKVPDRTLVTPADIP